MKEGQLAPDIGPAAFPYIPAAGLKDLLRYCLPCRLPTYLVAGVVACLSCHLLAAPSSSSTRSPSTLDRRSNPPNPLFPVHLTMLEDSLLRDIPCIRGAHAYTNRWLRELGLAVSYERDGHISNNNNEHGHPWGDHFFVSP